MARPIIAKSTCVLLASLLPQAVAAQMSAPSMRSAVPGVSGISLNNAAGVLRYCERHRLVSVVSADTVLSNFATKPMTSSPDYIRGERGQILGDGGKVFVIPAAPGHLQSQACDMVLHRAKKVTIGGNFGRGQTHR